MLHGTLAQSLLPAIGALLGGLLGGWAFDAPGAVAGAAAGAGATAFALARARAAAEAAPYRRAPIARRGPPARDGRELPVADARDLLDRMPVGIVLIDRRGRILFINGRAEGLFGRRPPGPVHVSALRAPRLLEGVESALRTGEAGSVSFGLARAGAGSLSASIRPLGMPAGRAAESDPALLVVIEERGEAERAAELHRDFVANASHELKTPLASISGIIETLTGHARDDAEATERFLGIMAAEVERMKRLVQDLLSLNRIELNERIRPEEPQPLPQIVREAARALEPLAAAREMRLACDLPGEAPLVPGDRRELMQLFSNLIDNAIKYGRPGTEVGVRIRGGGPGDSRVRVAVTDHGPGIGREHLPRLTERFYRVSASHSRAQGGTGLGLAIVKHIVGRHRGELKIESVPGEGATFTVILPVHGAETAGPGSPAGEEPGRVRTGPRGRANRRGRSRRMQATATRLSWKRYMTAI